MDALTILTGALFACMSIIWAGGNWRKYSKKVEHEYNNTLMSSSQMAASFIAIVIAVVIFIIIPLYKCMELITKTLS